MAVRALTRLLTFMLVLLLLAAPVSACFGPKLYWGVGPEPEQAVLYALASLYVKEKTGVESVRNDLAAGQDPLAELVGEQVDLAFVASAQAPGERLLVIEGLPPLVSGKRPLEDLQFTTVAPALRKLAGLLTREDVVRLAGQVAAGASELAVARQFLMERRWL